MVNIGARQHGRLHAENVAHADYDAGSIQSAVEAQLRHGRYPSSSIYYQPDTSRRIVDVLASMELYTQKQFHDQAAVASERT